MYDRLCTDPRRAHKLATLRGTGLGNMLEGLVEEIASRPTVRGRGGTVLQPGIDLLQQAEDFPKDAPLLVIPAGARLPLLPRGPVFRAR